MGANFIWEEIEKKKFRVISTYKEALKEKITNFGRTQQKYTTFGPFYEAYLYAFALGFHAGIRKKIEENEDLDTFNAVYEWADDPITKKKDILKNFFMIMLCEENIREESEFNFYGMEHLNNEQIKERIKKFLLIFEEYANAGFEIIYNKVNEKPEFLDNFTWAQELIESYISDS
jgi:hypothetical protein